MSDTTQTNLHAEPLPEGAGEAALDAALQAAATTDTTLEEHSIDQPATPVAPASQTTAQTILKKKPSYVALTSDGLNGLEEVDVNPVVGVDVTAGPQDNPRVNYTRNYDVEPPRGFVFSHDNPVPIETHLFLLSEQGAEVDKRIRSTATRSLLESTQGRVWNSANMVAASLSAQQDMVQYDSQKRETSQWHQYLEHEGAKHGFFSPKIETDKLPLNDPINARIRVRSLMGVGGVIAVPLFHSGFWIMLNAPSESALYELNRRFNDEKVSLGRMTQGLIFSNEQVYMNSWLLEFCLDHCYDATLKFADRDELRKHIKFTDLPVLFTGLARLIWPNGYRYIRAINTKDGITNSRMVEGKLDLAKLLFVDNPFFSTWQKNHMANRTRGTVTAEDLARYQSEFPFAAGRYVEMNSSIGLTLQVPNVEDAINDGDRWVAGLVQMVDETFTTTRPTPEKRNEIISTHAAMQEMLRYSSWVKSVTFDEIEHTNREVIESTLMSLSEEQVFREKFDQEVKKFIQDTTGALIAIPEYDGTVSELPRFPHLIPLDVVTVFFTLLMQKIAR